MRTPKQILDERFARGEISLGEYQQLSQSVNATAHAGQTMPAQARSANPWPWIGGVAGVLVLVALLIGYASENRLVLGHIEASSPGIVEFRLANPSANSGDIVFYVMENGVRKCEHISHMGAKTAKSFRINCVIAESYFEVRADWASNLTIGGIATRI